MTTNKKYLTIHGHFYQPPRENPWLESIEVQESAKPFHDWNERIDFECYNPNSVSRIVDGNNKIIDIVNNYEYISFNFGPTLLSWLEQYDSKTYERIIEADTASLQAHNGHGNAIAQNYNHIIMPLANEKDKYTQVIWGIKDFIYRFGRKPEGMWVAETAIDYATLDVLIDCGIKFTILSPFQALKVRDLGTNGSWTDISTGNIDPARSYRCYSKTDPEKYLDVFFYDGSISKSVAFDNLLQNGEKFIARLKDGVCPSRNYNQLVNIATDGESYGHHTKFGDMALSYVLKNRAEKEGFTIINYAQYLELEPPVCEVELKPVSSWSCFHGVERWNSDCGCQTGGQPGWNQKWRKPLREALNYLRDELVKVFEKFGGIYFKDVWKARNDYIDVILDRNDDTIEQFLKKHQNFELKDEDIVKAIKLLEMQRQSLLSFTSCGWFFSEISGIETIQIMKYAARAIQLAQEFAQGTIESDFLEILNHAKSNIPEFGTGKQIYETWVKPSVVDVKQFVSHWAITSLYQQHENVSDLYCYEMIKKDYRVVNKNRTDLVVGRIEACSKITAEKHDMIFALLHFGGEDFQCAIKDFTDITEYNFIKSDLIEKYDKATLTDVVRTIDEYFGKDYYTIKNLFTKEKKAILSNLLGEKLDKFANTFNELYSDGKASILQLREIGLETPMEFKIVAEYIISKKFNNMIKNAENLINDELVQKCLYYINEAQTLNVKLHKEPSRKIFEAKILRNIKRLVENPDIYQAHKLVNILSVSRQLEINPQIREAQNIYFQKIFKTILPMINDLSTSQHLKNDKILLNHLINVGELLDVDVKELYIKLSNVKEPR